MRIKFPFSALALLVAMTMGTSAFAQVGIFNVLPTPASRARIHGYAEDSGSVTFLLQGAQLNGTNTGTNSVTGEEADRDTITIAYGAPIANADTIGTDGIAVKVCTNDVVTSDMVVPIGPAGETEDEPKVSATGSRLTIRLKGSDCTTANGVIDVSGVRLRIVGSGQDSITARASSPSAGRVRITGTTEFTVISSINDELTDDGVAVKPKVSLIRHSGKPKTGSGLGTEFKLMLTENTADSFAGAMIDLELLGIPAGDDVEVEIDAWVITEEALDDDGDPKQILVNDVRTKVKLTSDQNEATVTFPSAATEAPGGLFVDDDATNEVDESDERGRLSSSKVDVVIIVGKITGLEEDELLPLGELNVQAVANIGPGSRSGSGGDVRFASDPTTAVTVIESSPDRTELTFSLAISNGTFDTGIAVINDGRLTGPITFTFYNMDGTSTTHTTSAASPGLGLDSAGMLAPKGTYLVLLSEMMPALFTGYIVATTDFTSAEGTGYISDFSGFSAAVSVFNDNND